jgi:isoleucyl-tRNA synthetase
LEAFIRSRSEWCISRQRVWGVPIPALYHTPSGRAILNPPTLDYILSVLEKRGVSHWWDGQVEDFVPPALREEGVPVHEVWQKGTDTMDVWFDSGTSWSMLEDTCAPQEYSGDRRGRLVADVCMEGSDQHRGWFQSQLLTAVGSAPREGFPTSPYRTLITHGMVLDEVGRKMSKSIGNVMNPMTVVNGGKVSCAFV